MSSNSEIQEPTMATSISPWIRPPIRNRRPLSASTQVMSTGSSVSFCNVGWIKRQFCPSWSGSIVSRRRGNDGNDDDDGDPPACQHQQWQHHASREVTCAAERIASRAASWVSCREARRRRWRWLHWSRCAGWIARLPVVLPILRFLGEI